jgi:hypothetical protein
VKILFQPHTHVCVFKVLLKSYSPEEKSCLFSVCYLKFCLPKACSSSPQGVQLVSPRRAASPQSVQVVSSKRASRLLKACKLSPQSVQTSPYGSRHSKQAEKENKKDVRN